MENITMKEFVGMYQLMAGHPIQADIAKRIGTSPVTMSRDITKAEPIRPEWMPMVDQMLMEMDFDRFETVLRTLKNRRIKLEEEARKATKAKMRTVYQKALEDFLATAFLDKPYHLLPVLADAELSRFTFHSDNGERLAFQHIDNSEPWSFLLNDPNADRFYMFTENVDVMQDLLMNYNELPTTAKFYPLIKRSVLLIDTETQAVIAEYPIITN